MKLIQKIGLVSFVALLLLPGSLQSAHIFTDHQHVYCDSNSDEHFHAKTFDCHFEDLQQQPFLRLERFEFGTLISTSGSEPVLSAYYFLIDNYRGSSSLRGPPAEA